MPRRKKKKQYKAKNLRFENQIPVYNDLPTTEQLRKNVYDYEVTETKITRAKRLNQTLLDTYLLKKLITESQHDAGIKYYKLWRYSGLEPKTTSALKPVVSSGSQNTVGLMQGDNYVELQKARMQLGKPLTSILDSVILYNEPIKTWEANYNVRSKTGMTVLIVGLDTLCDIWGIS